MAYPKFTNFVEGTLNAAITDAAAVSCTVNWASNTTVPTSLSATNYMLLVIDPEAAEHAPEIVKATGISGSSNPYTLTIVRAQESSSAQQWDSGRKIVGAVTGGALTNLVTTDDLNQTIAGVKTFSSAIVGNLTGNASGTAATVTGAAQSNITSVGTLTGLTVTGTTTLNGELKVNADDSDAAIYLGDQDGGNTRLRFDDSEETLFVDIDNTAVIGVDTTTGLQINLGVIDSGSGTGLVIQGISGNVLMDSSSIRYKNVADVNIADHLTASMVDSLEPKMFSYKNDSDNHPMIGFIAEDVDAISPFLAYHAGEQVETIDKDALIALLAIGLKDARTRIAALEG